MIVCVADDDLQTYAEARLRSARVDLSRVRFVEVAYDDTWLRDSGPITLRDGDGFRLLDFRFTGWGGKFEASRDDQLIERLARSGAVSQQRTRKPIDFALEGGAIETDGAGTLLTTWHCLHERHPGAIARRARRASCADWLRQDRVLWLDHGYLEGDDTDAHIDTLARFAAPRRDRVPGLRRPGRLALRRTAGDGRRNRRAAHARRPAVPPVPAAVGASPSSTKAAASPRRYANFLIVNGAVLMPAYGDRRRCRGRRRAGAGLPGPRDRAGALPSADLAERQPALHHDAIAAKDSCA